eukprot:638232-Pleurochrysis_carterae.AAC.3
MSSTCAWVGRFMERGNERALRRRRHQSMRSPQSGLPCGVRRREGGSEGKLRRRSRCLGVGVDVGVRTGRAHLEGDRARDRVTRVGVAVAEDAPVGAVGAADRLRARKENGVKCGAGGPMMEAWERVK